MRQEEQERHNREMQTIERIGASGLSRDGYVVQYLLDASRRGETDIEEVHIRDLGYEQNIFVWRQIGTLFKQLQKDGCIKGFERKVNTWVKVVGLNRACLEKKIKTYHPSHADPTSARKKWVDWAAIIGAVVAVATFCLGIADRIKTSSAIESLESRIHAIEELNNVQDEQLNTTSDSPSSPPANQDGKSGIP